MCRKLNILRCVVSADYNGTNYFRENSKELRQADYVTQQNTKYNSIYFFYKKIDFLRKDIYYNITMPTIRYHCTFSSTEMYYFCID
jgi:hypothetical protein